MNQELLLSSSTTTTENQEHPAMKAEIDAAVGFLTDFLVKSPKQEFSQESVDLFRRCLKSGLYRRYNGHWNSAQPLKGSGFRCLRINGMMDPLVEQAAQACRLPLRKVRQAFPAEVTVWVDPGDVSVRFGEDGSVGVWYEATRPTNDAEKTKPAASYQQRGSPSIRASTPPSTPPMAHSHYRVQQCSPSVFYPQQPPPSQHQQQPPLQWMTPQRPSPSSGFVTAMSHQQQQMQQQQRLGGGQTTPVRYHQSPSGSWRSSPQPTSSPVVVCETGEEQRCKILAERLMRENLNLMATLAPGLVSTRTQAVGVGAN